MKTIPFLVLLILTGNAAAEPLHVEPDATEDTASEKSPALAVAFSIAGTAAGWGAAFALKGRDERLQVLAAVGILGGPSLGHFYSGDLRAGAIHSGMRALGLSLWTFGGVIAAGRCLLSEGPCHSPFTRAFVYQGMFVFGVSSLYSVLAAPGAARRANAEHRVRLAVEPLLLPGDGLGAGLALGGSF